MTCAPAHPSRRGHRQRLTLALLAVGALALGACEAPDLADRFEAELLIADKDSPSEPTRVRFFPDDDQFPGDDQLFLLSKSGRVNHFRLVDGTLERIGGFMMPGVRPAPSDLGLADVVFDPLFASNRRVYFCFSTGDNESNRIVMLEWRDDNDYERTLESLQIVLDVKRNSPDKAWHGIYSMAFGKDRYLYTAIGDANHMEVAQDGQTLLGKLIRIEPLANGHYRIPPDNPNVGVDGVRDEIVASGLRTPFRMILRGNSIFIGDVGGNRFEEINLYTRPNQNFGWPICEGGCDEKGMRDPEIEIPRLTDPFQLADPTPNPTTRASLSLGVIYEGGNGDPYDGLLDDQLLFADIYRGYVRAAKVGLWGGISISRTQHLFHLEGMTSMDVGPDGYIYGTKMFPDAVFRIVPRD